MCVWVVYDKRRVTWEIMTHISQTVYIFPPLPGSPLSNSHTRSCSSPILLSLIVIIIVIVYICMPADICIILCAIIVIIDVIHFDNIFDRCVDTYVHICHVERKCENFKYFIPIFLPTCRQCDIYIYRNLNILNWNLTCVMTCECHCVRTRTIYIHVYHVYVLDAYVFASNDPEWS